MRQRPYAFVRVGHRWINDMASDMARLAGKGDPAPIDVARRVTLKDPEQVAEIRRWLMLNDEH